MEGWGAVGVLPELKEVEQRGGREGWMEAGGGRWSEVGWGQRGPTGALGRLLAFQLPPHYINTQWCHTLFTHASTHTH